MTTGEAFQNASKETCKAVRPQTEPDLMGWDPGSRANLSALRRQGVVAIRYKVEGCNVELEVLSNCIAKGEYTYAPYAATDTKIAHDERELWASLPIGAARLGTKVRGGRALRTDYTLVGVQSLPVRGMYPASELANDAACARATHVVSRIYVGGFAMVAGERSAIDASASVFAIGGGGSHAASNEHVAIEGVPDACARAQTDGKETPQCSAPLRIGLLAIEDRAEGGCAIGATWDGKTCVQQPASESSTAFAKLVEQAKAVLANTSKRAVFDGTWPRCEPAGGTARWAKLQAEVDELIKHQKGLPPSANIGDDRLERAREALKASALLDQQAVASEACRRKAGEDHERVMGASNEYLLRYKQLGSRSYAQCARCRPATTEADRVKQAWLRLESEFADLKKARPSQEASDRAIRLLHECKAGAERVEIVEHCCSQAAGK